MVQKLSNFVFRSIYVQGCGCVYMWILFTQKNVRDKKRLDPRRRYQNWVERKQIKSGQRRLLRMTPYQKCGLIDVIIIVFHKRWMDQKFSVSTWNVSYLIDNYNLLYIYNFLFALISIQVTKYGCISLVSRHYDHPQILLCQTEVLPHWRFFPSSARWEPWDHSVGMLWIF